MLTLLPLILITLGLEGGQLLHVVILLSIKIYPYLSIYYSMKLWSYNFSWYSCSSCDEHCATCNDERDNNCLTCHDGFKLTAEHKCVENKTCPEREYRPIGGGDCQKCDTSCFSCHDNSAGACTSCNQDRWVCCSVLKIFEQASYILNHTLLGSGISPRLGNCLTL